MSAEPDDSGDAVAGLEPAARQRLRRRAAALGDLVPDRSVAETERDGRDQVPDGDYLREVPPHHG